MAVNFRLRAPVVPDPLITVRCEGQAVGHTRLVPRPTRLDGTNPNGATPYPCASSLLCRIDADANKSTASGNDLSHPLRTSLDIFVIRIAIEALKCRSLEIKGAYHICQSITPNAALKIRDNRLAETYE